MCVCVYVYMCTYKYIYTTYHICCYIQYTTMTKYTNVFIKYHCFSYNDLSLLQTEATLKENKVLIKLRGAKLCQCPYNPFDMWIHTHIWIYTHVNVIYICNSSKSTQAVSVISCLLTTMERHASSVCTAYGMQRSWFVLHWWLGTDQLIITIRQVLSRLCGFFCFVVGSPLFGGSYSSSDKSTMEQHAARNFCVSISSSVAYEWAAASLPHSPCFIMAATPFVCSISTALPRRNTCDVQSLT